MWPWYNYLPDPKLNEYWCIKGNENKERTDFYELVEKKMEDNVTFYRLIDGKTGISMGWIGLDHMRKHYVPWNDPWKVQRAWAKQYGFTFKGD